MVLRAIKYLIYTSKIIPLNFKLLRDAVTLALFKFGIISNNIWFKNKKEKAEQQLCTSALNQTMYNIHFYSTKVAKGKYKADITILVLYTSHINLHCYTGFKHFTWFKQCLK